MSASSLQRENIVYKVDGKDFEGSLVHDAAARGRRPGVLVCHAWMGLDAYARLRAVQLARLGYTVFALDMYGAGILAENADQAGKLMTALRDDRPLLRERALAGLQVLREHRLTMSRSLAVIGYCFGGLVALELARSGTDLRAAVSFHGLLDKGNAPTASPMKTRVLALHGAEDPMVPPAQVLAFQQELREAQADWQFVSYGGAMHGFSNPEADDAASGILHHEPSERRSWAAMQAFLQESFNS